MLCYSEPGDGRNLMEILTVQAPDCSLFALCCDPEISHHKDDQTYLWTLLQVYDLLQPP